MLLLWPGWVRRKREDDFGLIVPALFAGTNISDQSIKEISSTSYNFMPSLETHFFSLKANQYGSLSTKNKQKLVPLCTQMILSVNSKRSYVMMRMGTSTAHQSYHQIVKR